MPPSADGPVSPAADTFALRPRRGSVMVHVVDATPGLDALPHEFSVDEP